MATSITDLPESRRISHGRTHGERWDALRYACAVQVHRPTVPVAAIYRAIGWIVLAVILVPLALHLVLRVVR
jgi:hypothetical protein